jgi:hypothetical protein
MKKLFYMFFVLIFIACNSENINMEILNKFPDKFEYVVFEKGKELKRIEIRKDDKIYTNLVNWIMQNASWKKSYSSYAPQYVFTSEALKINLIDGLAVVNINTMDNKWVQVTRKIEEKERQNIIQNAK